LTTKTGNDKLQQMTLAETDPSRISTPDLETAEQSLEQRLQIRRHNAITEGRILPFETPQFIGTYDLELPPRGLFEVYLDSPIAEDGKFSGKIEDTLGTATFTGTITKKEIIFTKNYCPDKSSGKASKTEISYIGRFNGVQYEGTYEIRDKNFVLVKKPFQLRMFTDLVARNQPYRVAPENRFLYLLAETLAEADII